MNTENNDKWTRFQLTNGHMDIKYVDKWTNGHVQYGQMDKYLNIIDYLK